MKKIFTVLTVLLALNVTLIAAPGDTTTIQAHNDVWLTWNGNYDTAVEFPDGSKSYRKIVMTFTVGKYVCPGSPQYCGDWDYTVHIDLRTKAGDTLEIARMITPYANASYARTPWTWKQRYVYDVTDFYNQLKDSATVRINYSGYSGGFTGNIRFEMIEGIPPRNVLGVDRLWNTSSRFGDTSAAAAKIEDRIDTKTLTAVTGTQFAEMMFTISGHGNDDNGCCEFSKKYYEVELNNSRFDKTDIWRDDCGFNHIYPQSGTWVYDRGNWCPGDVVFPNFHKLAGVTGGNTYDLDVDFESYIGSKNISGRSWGSYSIAAHVFYYAGFNKTVDASLDDIIAPSNHETHYRFNPTTGRPIVTVKNTGSTTITSIKFKYEMAGGSGQREYTWNGSMPALESAKIELDTFRDLMTATGTHEFNVEIVVVNGSGDEDATNNKMSSTFVGALQVPAKLVVEMRTNKSTMGLSGVSENSWKIIDIATNTVVAKRENCAPSTTYNDTIDVQNAGMYKLVVEDAGCDGLSFWANPNAGSGNVYLKRTNSPIPFALDGYFSGDFGCGFTQYFNVLQPSSVSDVAAMNPAMSVYPNPAQTTINVALTGMLNAKGTILMKDMVGRTILHQQATDEVSHIDVSGLSNGVYTIVYINSEGTQKLQSRVVVAR